LNDPHYKKDAEII